MKQFGNVILIILISAVVCSAMLFTVTFLDFGGTSKSDHIAMLEKKIGTLEAQLKTLRNEKTEVTDDEFKDYIDEIESKLKLSSNNYDSDEFKALEDRLNKLENKNNPEAENQNYDEIINSDEFKEALNKLLNEYKAKAKEEQAKKARGKEFEKIYGRFKEDLLKIAKMLGLSDADVEKILGVGEEYIDQILGFKEDFDGIKENLTPEERQEYLLKQKELERSQFYEKIRDSVGDETFMKLRTESRRREDMKKFEPIANKLNLENWQKDKINDALNQHYEQTKYIDMVMKTEKLDLNNATEYQKQIEDSWKLFSNELLNSILTEEQRKLALSK